MIELKLLGALDARGPDGERLDALLAQPRRLALLAYLLLEGRGAACPRERLMALFWPDAAPAQAATNLRQALAFLRRVLGDGVLINVGPQALRVAEDSLRCDALQTEDRRELLQGLNLSGTAEAWEDWLRAQREGPPEHEPARHEAPSEPDPAARAAYLRGRFHWGRRPRDSLKALASLEEAVRLAPDYAPAQAALADVYNTLGSWEAGTLLPQQAFPQAKQAALRALRQPSCCAAGHTSLAYAQAHYDWDWQGAAEQFERALMLDPGYAHAHHWQAHLLVAQRRFDAARAAGERALALQPDDVIINVHMAWHHWIASEPEAAIAQADRTAELDDTDHWPPFFKGLACVQCGRGEAAVEQLREACRLSRGHAVMRAGLGYVYAATGERRAARTVLREFSEAAATQQRFAYEAAVIHAALDETEPALELLEQALRSRSAWMAYLAVDPRLQALRTQPRFNALLRALGLD